MKRVVLSLLLSTMVITFYVVIAVIIQLIFDLSEEVIELLAIPLRLPSYIYYNVLHLQDTNNSYLEEFLWIVSAYIFNIVMYAPIFYLLLTLIPKRKPKVEPSELPPEPPIFN